MPAVITPSNLGTEFDIGVVTANKITVLAATDVAAGKVALAKAANYPAQVANDVKAATPAYVAAAIAAIPSDTAVNGGSYTAATNTLTLTKSNGGTAATVDLTALVTDVIATIPVATDVAQGTVTLAVAANMPSTSDIEAATPAYINSKINQAGAFPVILTDAFGVNILRGGNA